VAAILSVLSHVGVLALVLEWWRCSAIACLAVLGLVVGDECVVDIVFVARARSHFGCARSRSGPGLADGGVGAGTRGVHAGL
jgi:hypothetical protein